MKRDLIQIQIGLFLSSDYKGSFESISLKIQSVLGVPQFPVIYTPIPQDAPSEIPRVSLRYPTFNINISKNRIDLFSDTYENIKDTALKVAGFIVNDFLIQINRVAMVKTFFSESSVADLKKMLNKELGALESKEITIRINLDAKGKDYQYNNIETTSLGSFAKKDEQNLRNGVLIVRDVNTVPDPAKPNFPIPNIVNLLEEFNAESDKEILLK